MSFPRLLKRVYCIGGEPLLVVHADSRAALDALELQPFCDSDALLPPHALEIFLVGGVIANLARIEAPESAETVYAGNAVTILAFEGRQYGAWFGKAASVSDSQSGRAVISIPGLRHYNPDFISRLLFRPVLDRLFFDRGWLPLHAAAFTRDARGFLLIGGTGAGKTTLLSRLMEEGAGFLSDDRALIRFEDDRFFLHAFPERMRMAVTPLGRKRSRRVPGPAVSIAELEMIIFLDPDPAEVPRASRIGAAEAGARLLQSVSPYLESRERIKLLPAIERLCRGAACCLIRGWGNSAERFSLVERLIGEGLSR